MASIFSIDIPRHTKIGIFHLIENCLISSGSKPLFLVTLNPEIALKARQDNEYKNILKKSVNIVDGFGIKLVAAVKGLKIGERIAGVELTEKILSVAVKRHVKTTVVIHSDGLSSKREVERMLENKFFLTNYSVIEEKRNGSRSSIAGDTELLIVGLGAPYQEKFIDRRLLNLPNLRCAIGVGGTLDFWTNRQKRAPRIFRKYGFEWLWRVITQPNRIKRIWNALVVFPIYGIIYSKK
ncbi:MAG: WecB/TagA/CpsF family glycosyltransferase [Patescibacteria group bacterium]|nr:WecB/TagA/CpsF family glycosyltransferase [Patescibacteria group bacterium]